MDSTEGSAECLPIDFLRLLFGRLSARDLCSAACVCRLWNELTRECWRAKVQRRWKHGRGSARWRSFAQRGEWKRVYRERHLRDCAARAALRDLPWPVRREAALATLVAAGDETLDELLAAAVATTAPVSGAGPGPGSAATSGGGGGSGGLSEQGLRLRGPRLLGQRYWVEMALAALRKREAVAVLHRLARDPRVAEERPEAGALAIAQAHYPTADLSGVEAEVAALGRELRRRMDAEGAPPGSLHALRILNHLLFGPPPPPQSTPPPSQPSQPQPQATAHTATAPPAAAAAAAAAASGAALLATQLAGCDGGLGLRGCEVDDYYNPANSMLCDVLARRRGIPISLALLHLAVARRGGLGGRLELIGLPTRVVNRFVPTITTITTAPIAATADSVAAAAEGGAAGSSSSTTSSGGGGGDGGSRGGEGEEEVFIDVFGGGTRLSWSQLRSKMAGLGVPVQRGHVRALSPSQIYERMCANLYSIYRNAGDMTCLRLVLELCGAVAEQSRDLLIRRYRVGLALEDWSDAAECLDAMTAALTAPPAASGAALGAGTAGAPQPPPQQQGGLQQGQQQQPGQAGSAVGSAGGAAAEAGDGEDQHLRQQLAAHMSRVGRVGDGG
ncbi:hypothetical protein PLESTB_001155900 [Pleodorina starrii]|uniref:F-box domain-containing protein n=1 Tax=Pleodorina starrii TaxID=330485 RepID=A0A9W6F5C6_9CHLO|nr:hypothetical protein PLESTB_001155900 [Pleodorina starrii]